MTEKNEATVNNNEATQNNYQPRELKLEPKELMRFSLFDVGEGKIEVNYLADDNADPSDVLTALTQLLENVFCMTCVPKCLLGGIIEVTCGNVEDLENILATMNTENSCKGEHTEAEGEDNNE